MFYPATSLLNSCSILTALLYWPRPVLMVELQGSGVKFIALEQLPHKESLIPQHMTVNSDVYVRWDSIDPFGPAQPCFENLEINSSGLPRSKCMGSTAGIGDRLPGPGTGLALQPDWSCRAGKSFPTSVNL